MNTATKRKLTRRQLDQKVLYFAYGSNMHQPRLEARVGKVKLLGKHDLLGFKLTFDAGYGVSFANVGAAPEDFCQGLVYEMTYGQLRVLDKYEGLYERLQVMRGKRKLHYYICERMRRHNAPVEMTMEYYSVLMLGCTEHKLKKSLEIVSQHKPDPRRIDWDMACFYAE